MTTEVKQSLQLKDVTLEKIFKAFLKGAYGKYQLNPEDVENLKNVFYSGADAALAVHNAGMTQMNRATEAADAYEEAGETDKAYTAMTAADEWTDQTFERLEYMSKEVQDYYAEMEPDQVVEVAETEPKAVDADFDLATWTPEDKPQ